MEKGTHKGVSKSVLGVLMWGLSLNKETAHKAGDMQVQQFWPGVAQSIFVFLVLQTAQGWLPLLLSEARHICSYLTAKGLYCEVLLLESKVTGGLGQIACASAWREMKWDRRFLMIKVQTSWCKQVTGSKGDEYKMDAEMQPFMLLLFKCGSKDRVSGL